MEQEVKSTKRVCPGKFKSGKPCRYAPTFWSDRCGNHPTDEEKVLHARWKATGHGSGREYGTGTCWWCNVEITIPEGASMLEAVGIHEALPTCPRKVRVPERTGRVFVDVDVLVGHLRRLLDANPDGTTTFTVPRDELAALVDEHECRRRMDDLNLKLAGLET